MGIDIGSTTAKVVILDKNNELVFSAYQRHQTKIMETLNKLIIKSLEKLGDITVRLMVTGSAGMGITERFDLPFVQEVVASAEVVEQLYPDVKTLIDIGGEDAKMIFFKDQGGPDIRMNGSCAGGTGAFIDEMANLLDIPVSELNVLASNHKNIYPMASRCGVFAKTDLQNLLSRDVPKTDIAASVFHAIVLQTLATLSRGYDPNPLVLFSGGPLTFLPALKKAFTKVMGLESHDVLDIEKAEYLTAIGAAISTDNILNAENVRTTTISDLLAHFESNQTKILIGQDRLDPLFPKGSSFPSVNSENPSLLGSYKSILPQSRIARITIDQLNENNLFLGVDSGSTTTKLVLIDIHGRVVFDYYCNNRGNSIQAVQDGLKKIYAQFTNKTSIPNIVRSVVTGYGEDLIKAAFDFDEGMVETLAHCRAAKEFDEDVSFIMDIGGQDMKAIFVNNGHIQNIEINEACSSGCGSFIESFARSMGYTVEEFAQKACEAENPCDLGARCTVFMNSRVKQALRENADITDISAGLAYSVVKNALHKVLNITDTDQLGDHIVVQGGAFKNPAIRKAMEIILGKSVTCSDMAELMGAYGAALTARDYTLKNDLVVSNLTTDKTTSKYLKQLLSDKIQAYSQKEIRCQGCENKCVVTQLTFPNGNIFYSGNSCENIFNNSGRAGKNRKGKSLPAIKYDLLFNRKTTPDDKLLMTIGIPRVLNMFENFPFWNTLLVECNIKVHLSSVSSNELYQKGAAHIMSENLCFPGKLVAGHIMDLIESRHPEKGGIDRILYPIVFYEIREFTDTVNTYNCPIVTGYPEVVRSAIDSHSNFDIPLDMPEINFEDKKLLKTACIRYLKSLGIEEEIIERAYQKALDAQQAYKDRVRTIAEEIQNQSRSEGRPLILLLSRPYHIDPVINHKIPDILTNFGLDVITEDAVVPASPQEIDNTHVMTQWTYINRYFHAARWARNQKGVKVVQLNSFGCGPDPFILDEVKTILGEYGQYPLIVRIDEIESAGSTKLRLRSMIESMDKEIPEEQKIAIETKNLTHELEDQAQIYKPRKTTKVYNKEDRGRILIVPDFSTFCSPPVVRPFVDQGHTVVCLPRANQESVDVALKYTNNELCYPAIICIGDLTKALLSGKYDLSRVAIGFVMTGGQCRATSYTSMIKKAIVAAGFESVPVVTLSTTLKNFNEQPGFKLNVFKYKYRAILGILFFDALSDMYHAVAIREKHPGTARKVVDKYIKVFMNGNLPTKRRKLLSALKQAINEFNNIETKEDEQEENCGYPKVGIVGEIFVKYNEFSNNDAVQWLIDHKMEVVMPTLLEYFLSRKYSVNHHVKTKIKEKSLNWLLSFVEIKLMRFLSRGFNKAMKDFRYDRQHHDIKEIANLGSEILSLNHQFGEGWLIAAEIAAFAHHGVKNVLCLQPFGCIANHVVAKGVQKRLKEKFPQLNLLFLDVDAGVSKVNFFNRLHFFINHAKVSHYEKQHKNVQE